MKYNPKIHNRKSIRLKGYDYSQAELYFITICCKNRACLFGDIVDGKMIYNDAGKIAIHCWLDIPNHFPNSVLHEYIVMPNHIHGIIELKFNSVVMENSSPNTTTADENGGIGTNENVRVGANYYSPLRSPSKTIGSIVRGFKIGATKWMRKNMDVYDVWQRNYYDIIIRNEKSYQTISKYIKNNPAKWADDKFHTN